MSEAGPWRDLVRAGRLAVPVECAGCAAPDLRWCEECEAPWWQEPRRCETSAARLDVISPALPVWSVTVLEGPVHATVAAWKDGGRRDLDRDLAQAMTRAARAVAPALAEIGEPVTVVPCPARAAHTRRRGADLPVLLARAAAVGLRSGRLTAEARALLAPAAGESRGAGDRERWRAAAPVAVRTAGGRRPSPVVLVDDVLTTGATMARAARALEEAGRVPVAAIVMAVAPGVHRSAPRALL